MLSAAAIDRRHDFAKDLARGAAAIAMDYASRRSALDIQSKGRRDYVTAADKAVEQFIRDQIAASFAEDSVLGEEGGGRAAEHLWVVDPIDGTSNFARGLPHFTVSIAFCDGGQPVVGVIGEPVTGAVYAARRGGGAFLDGARIQVSGVAALDQAIVEHGYAERHSAEENLAMKRRLLDAGCDVRTIGSAALGLARVADGRLDAYCELHLNSWDVMAGLVLIAEAGGRVNDFLARDGLLKGNAMLGATPGVYDALSRVTGIAAA